MTILLSLLAAAAAAPQPAPLKTFSDWTVGCDNGGACQAVGLMPETMPDGALTMRVRRGAAALATPEITFVIDDGASVTLEADGKRLPIRFVAVEEGASVRPADVPTTIAALRSARSLRVVDRRGAPVGTVSAAGASAALLYMDERQRRVGTVTALVRPGARPASTIPPPPPLPVVRSAAFGRVLPVSVDAKRIAALRNESGCTIDEVGGPDEVHFDAIDGSSVLVLLACGSGAYNVSHVPFVARHRGGALSIEPATFDVKHDWWEGGHATLINAEWDSRTGLLSTFSRGRGLGDCGTVASYAWDGARFRLVEQSEMDECRGSQDFITTWRAQVVRR